MLPEKIVANLATILVYSFSLVQIVADNYDELVHKVKKDAVVFFYAPWCGHCKVRTLVVKGTVSPDIGLYLRDYTIKSVLCVV